MKKSYLAAALSLSAALCTTVSANMLKDGGFENPKAKHEPCQYLVVQLCFLKKLFNLIGG